MEYYIVAIKILDKTFFCIWYTDVKDGFLTKNNQLLSFADVVTLKQYCKQNNIELSSFDITLDDVDFFIDWVKNPNDKVDCKKFLDFWNTVADVSDSLNLCFFGNEEGIVLDIYNKLFYGNNLPAVREDGELYMPIWNCEEIFILTKIIENAISIMSESIYNSKCNAHKR